MSKKNKLVKEIEAKNAADNLDTVVTPKPQEVIREQPKNKNKDLKTASKDNKDAKKKKKEKKTNVIVRKSKETFSELKKVTWPSAAVVAKKTGVVLAVVVIFAVVLFGIDYLLSLLFGLFTGAIK